MGHRDLHVRTVYPRASGGTSSRNRLTSVCRRIGSIPARAGEPCCADPLPVARHWAVYPRASGGTPGPLGRQGRTRYRGLSPRERGNHAAGELVKADLCQGLSPRERGNRLTVMDQSPIGFCGLSPRERGNLEPAVPRRWLIADWGLSPRERGNPSVPCYLPNHIQGSIPARAGEPPVHAVQKTHPARAVYPRASGGTKSGRLAVLDASRRSIPARAGEPLKKHFPAEGRCRTTANVNPKSVSGQTPRPETMCAASCTDHRHVRPG